MMNMGSMQRESWVRTVIRQAEIGSVWQVAGLEKESRKMCQSVSNNEGLMESCKSVGWEGGHIGLGQSSDVSRYLLVKYKS